MKFLLQPVTRNLQHTNAEANLLFELKTNMNPNHCFRAEMNQVFTHSVVLAAIRSSNCAARLHLTKPSVTDHIGNSLSDIPEIFFSFLQQNKMKSLFQTQLSEWPHPPGKCRLLAHHEEGSKPEAWLFREAQTFPEHTSHNTGQHSTKGNGRSAPS